MRAEYRFACFLSCRAALSLPLVRYCRPVIGLLVIAPPDAIASVPSVPSAASSSPRHHHLVITPADHVLTASRPASLVEERGGATNRLRLRDVQTSLPCCLLARCRFPVSCDLARLLPSRHHRHLVRSCVLLPRMCRRRGAGDAVRPLRLLPRWSVLIMFKMLPYQFFKTLRLFGMALLCGYRGGSVCSIASPPYLGFISSVSGLGLIACVLCVAAHQFLVLVPLLLSCFSLPSPPVRYDRRGGGYGRGVILLARRNGERGVRSHRCCHAFIPLLTQCVPRIARRRAALSYRRRSFVPFPHGALARLSPSCPPVNIAPPNRHGRRGDVVLVSSCVPSLLAALVRALS